MKIKTFIDKKLKEYREPSREGTPKGEPIGLSKQKFRAALYVGLTNFKGQKIAKLVGVSHSLLRNWKMESAFKEVTVEAARNFISTIIGRAIAGPPDNPEERALYSDFLKREAGSTINGRVYKISGVVVADVILQKDELTESQKNELEGLVRVAKFFFGVNSGLYLRAREVLIAKLSSKPKLTDVDVKYMVNTLGNAENI